MSESRALSDNPRVTVKIAQTLDGRIATRTGQSQWISSETSRAFAHELRASHDAVLVGIGTVVYDNPRLTVRLVQGADPLRVVVDTHARIPLDSHVLTDGVDLTRVFVSDDAPTDRIAAIRASGAKVLKCARTANGKLDLADILTQLAGDGIRSVMVEGGAGIITTLLARRLVDRLIVCVAPKVLGAGLDAVGDLGIRSLADAIVFDTMEIRQLGPDVIFDGMVTRVGRLPSPRGGPDRS